VLAPGKSVVSLRVPGSYVDTAYPEARVEGDAQGRYFRGSGTSQATAVVAGQVALLLDAAPKLTPDQVKALLRATARPLAQHPQPAMGAGVSDVTAALARLKASKNKVTAPRSAAARSRGTGSLEAARGGEHVVDPMTGDELLGERDALGNPWPAARWAADSTRGTAWVKGRWNGKVWTGEKWQSDSFTAAAWDGASWNGIAWADHEWSDARWEARSWRARSWRARSWRDDSWLARSWRGLP
jgi:serine protease AprX